MQDGIRRPSRKGNFDLPGGSDSLMSLQGLPGKPPTGKPLFIGRGKGLGDFLHAGREYARIQAKLCMCLKNCWPIAQKSCFSWLKLCFL